MTIRPLFEKALDAAREWHRHIPQATEFCDWPIDLTWQERAANKLPAADLIISDPGHAVESSRPVLNALQAISGHLEWRHTYTADEVGQHFLDNFGWFELAGPDGHFITQQARITVGYWGPNLFYPRHQHGPEELYTVLSGQAVFHADGEPDLVLSAGNTRLHKSNQPHAMTTEDHPILTLVFWRGDGLNEMPRMTE